VNKLTSETREPFIFPFRSPEFNGDGLALDPTQIGKPLPKCLEERRTRACDSRF